MLVFEGVPFVHKHGSVETTPNERKLIMEIEPIENGDSPASHASFQGSKSASSPGPQPPQAVGSQQQEEDYHDTQPPDVSSHTIHGTNGMSTYMNG